MKINIKCKHAFLTPDVDKEHFGLVLLFNGGAWDYYKHIPVSHIQGDKDISILISELGNAEHNPTVDFLEGSSTAVKTWRTDKPWEKYLKAGKK